MCGRCPNFDGCEDAGCCNGARVLGKLFEMIDDSGLGKSTLLASNAEKGALTRVGLPCKSVEFDAGRPPACDESPYTLRKAKTRSCSRATKSLCFEEPSDVLDLDQIEAVCSTNRRNEWWRNVFGEARNMGEKMGVGVQEKRRSRNTGQLAETRACALG